MRGAGSEDVRVYKEQGVNTVTVAVLVAAGCDPVLAVVRAGTQVARAQVVVNPDPSRGQRSSLALAVDALSTAAAVAVLLVDVPGVGAEAVRSVCAAWRPGRIAVGRYAGRISHGAPTPFAF